MINRFIVIVLDSLGIGALPDAAKFNDEGANTLEHIIDTLGDGFFLPQLANLGLYALLSRHSQKPRQNPAGAFGKMACASPAKDSTVGHWELMGVISPTALPTYPQGFPQDVITPFETATGLKALGNCTASGTEIIQRLGAEHIASGNPIVYTSADSVFQIAAHEESFGLEKLYALCQIARTIMQGKHAVGRVIARPFTGTPGHFVRTENRKDFSLNPPRPTLLDAIQAHRGAVVAIGKITDLFNAQGITKEIHTRNNGEGMAALLQELRTPGTPPCSILFANLVDFDMLWGHRRDAAAYGAGLLRFDRFLPSLFSALQPEDVVVITADHGCDPTYTKHTDHTREYVPLLVAGKPVRKNVALGIRPTFADLAQTIADSFHLAPLEYGTSFKAEII